MNQGMHQESVKNQYIHLIGNTHNEPFKRQYLPSNYCFPNFKKSYADHFLVYFNTASLSELFFSND